MQPDTPLDDNDLERLGALPDAVPAPLEPLDVSALDGYLCGVLLQPRPVPAGQWQAPVADVEGRPAPPGPALGEFPAPGRRRQAQLDPAIGPRPWVDPWVFPLNDRAPATSSRRARGSHGCSRKPEGARRRVTLAWTPTRLTSNPQSGRPLSAKAA